MVYGWCILIISSAVCRGVCCHEKTWLSSTSALTPYYQINLEQQLCAPRITVKRNWLRFGTSIVFSLLKFDARQFPHQSISLLKEYFPAVRPQGRFFPLAHNLLKHLKQLGLQVLYNDHSEFPLKSKMITALCFFPVSHNYTDAFSEDLPNKSQSYPNWFVENYVERPIKPR